MQILSKVLESKVYPFTIELACLASRRDFLNLDKWISEKCRSEPAFFTACLGFLSECTVAPEIFEYFVRILGAQPFVSFNSEQFQMKARPPSQT